MFLLLHSKCYIVFKSANFFKVIATAALLTFVIFRFSVTKRHSHHIQRPKKKGGGGGGGGVKRTKDIFLAKSLEKFNLIIQSF